MIYAHGGGHVAWDGMAKEAVFEDVNYGAAYLDFFNSAPPNDEKRPEPAEASPGREES